MRSLLEAFGFDNLWVAWIMHLTSSTFFSILVNRVPSQPFSPSRVFDKGTPSPPSFFVILVEGLGRYIKASVEEGSLKGLPLHNL
jgi:hypothetical protein